MYRFWHNAIKELRDLDIAWSQKGTEMEDSKHVLFMPFSAIRYAETTESRTKDKSKKMTKYHFKDL